VDVMVIFVTYGLVPFQCWQNLKKVLCVTWRNLKFQPSLSALL